MKATNVDAKKSDDAKKLNGVTDKSSGNSSAVKPAETKATNVDVKKSDDVKKNNLDDKKPNIDIQKPSATTAASKSPEDLKKPVIANGTSTAGMKSGATDKAAPAFVTKEIPKKPSRKFRRRRLSRRSNRRFR